MTLEKWIIEFRQAFVKCDWSMVEIARRVGVSCQRLSKYKAGKSFGSDETMKEIFDIVKLDKEYQDWFFKIYRKNNPYCKNRGLKEWKTTTPKKHETLC